jgi:hypothetical protein
MQRGTEVARYPRSYEHGLWLPPPLMRAEPVAAPPLVRPQLTVAPPELADYAELCACRDASGARMRVRAAGFPATKTLEDFDWSAQPSADKPLVLHLAQLADRGARQRLFPRSARHRQDAPRDRARPQGLRARPPRRLRHRPGMGQPVRVGAGPQPTRGRATTARALPPADRRRGRLPAARTPSRQPTCSSRSSRAATNAARSSSPQTAASSNGARSSATRWSPPPSSTGSSTTPP